MKFSLKRPCIPRFLKRKKARWAKVFPKIIPSFLQKFPWAETKTIGIPC